MVPNLGWVDLQGQAKFSVSYVWEIEPITTGPAGNVLNDCAVQCIRKFNNNDTFQENERKKQAEINRVQRGG